MSSHKNDFFWLDDPFVLINPNRWSEIVPTREMDNNEKLNSLTRLVIIFTLVYCFFNSKNIKFILGSSLTIIIFIIFIQRFSQRPNINVKEEILRSMDLNHEIEDSSVNPFISNNNNCLLPSVENPQGLPTQFLPETLTKTRCTGEGVEELSQKLLLNPVQDSFQNPLYQPDNAIQNFAFFYAPTQAWIGSMGDFSKFLTAQDGETCNDDTFNCKIQLNPLTGM